MTAFKIDSNPVPNISGSDFGNRSFDLVQFHFHWGYNDYQGIKNIKIYNYPIIEYLDFQLNKGSEHFIDGQKFPLEVFNF